jgi:hypothetical protein
MVSGTRRFLREWWATIRTLLNRDRRDVLLGEVEPEDMVEFMYADPVDENGNRIGIATFSNVTTSWGAPVRVTKIPHAEMALPHIEEDSP